jgi:hypothetical protein
MALYTKVVNLPSANTAYLIRTLLLAIDPGAPLILQAAKIKAASANAGKIAIGDANMTSVADGDELDAGESSSEQFGGGAEGIALDTSSTYLIGSAVNQKAVISGSLL